MIKAARRTKSYAAADVAKVNGIKTSIATSTSPVTYLKATDFNGTAIVSVTGVLDLPRTVTISLSNSVGSYVASAITLTGTRGGVTVTETLTPPDANGNTVLRGTQAFDVLDSVAFPAQVNTSGAWQIGVQDICAPFGDKFAGAELAAAGTINVQYGEGSQGLPDAIPVAAGLVGIPKWFAASRVLTSTALAVPTTVGVTVYLA